ncbi:YncE family protein [Kitasatospora sp. LaBMicrA B282]|uniref:YncE family protein n=1 Tax=Kitasatospora sp. LaBMicrA B282 TaxID=3420949 RepID=UPI003D0A6D4C
MLLSLALAGALMAVGAGTASAAPAGASAVDPVPGGEATITLPASPWGHPLISADGTTAYVGVGQGNSGNSLEVIDTQAGVITTGVQVGSDMWSGPKVFSADGKLIYLVTEGTLNVFDTTTNTVRSRIPFPDQPRPAGYRAGGTVGLAISPDGSTLYLDQDQPFADFQPPVGQGRILTFSTAQNAFTDSTPLPTGVLQSILLRPNGKDAYITTPQGVLHLDVSGAHPTVVRTVTSAEFNGTVSLSPDGTRLYALAAGNHELVLDLTTDTQLADIDLKTSFAVEDTAVNLDGTRLYVSVDTQNPGPTIYAYDTATNTPVPDETITPSDLEHALGMTVGPDGQTLYVTGFNASDNVGSYLQIISI